MPRFSEVVMAGYIIVFTVQSCTDYNSLDSLRQCSDLCSYIRDRSPTMTTFSRSRFRFRSRSRSRSRSRFPCYPVAPILSLSLEFPLEGM